MNLSAHMFTASVARHNNFAFAMGRDYCTDVAGVDFMLLLVRIILMPSPTCAGGPEWWTV